MSAPAISSSAVLARASRLLWVRHVALRLSTSSRAVLAGVATLAVMLVALAVALAVVAAGGGAAFRPDLTTMNVLFVAAGAAAGLAAVAARVLMPPSSAMKLLADLLPVSRMSTVLGLQFDAVAGSSLLALAVSSPALATFGRIQPVWVAVMACSLLVGFVVVTVALVTGLLMLVERGLAAVSRLSSHHTRALASSVTGLSVLAVSVYGIRAAAEAGPAPLAAPGAAAHLVGRLMVAGEFPGWSIITLIAWTAAAVGAVVLGGSSRAEESPSDAASIITGVNVPPGRTGLVWLEVLQIIRGPQFLLLVLLETIVVGLACTLGPAFARGAVELMAPTLVVAPAFFTLHSYGRTSPHHWIASVVRGATGAGFWIGPKALASAAVSVVLMAISGAALAGAGFDLFGWSSAIVVGAALALGATLFGSVLAPYDSRDSLSTLLTTVAVAVTYGVSSLLATALTRVQVGEVAANLGLAVLLVLAYAVVGRRHAVLRP